MSADSQRMGQGQRGRGCAIAAAVLIVLIGLGGLGVHFYDRHWEKKVEARVAGYRAAGQPVAWEEVVAARRHVPDEENSALILLDAFPYLQPAKGAYAELLVYDFESESMSGARHSEQVRALIEAHLEANAEALERIHEAAQFPHGAYPLDPLGRPWEQPFDHLGGVGDALHLCCVEAAFHAEAGDARKAAACLKAGRAVSASLGDCTRLIEGFIRIATGTIWVGGVQRVLELCEMPADDLRMLREQAALADEGLSMELAFYGDRAMGHALFEAEGVAELVGAWGVDASPRLYLYAMLPGWRERDALDYYDLLDGAIRASGLPLAERQHEAEALEDEEIRLLMMSPVRHALFAILVPATGRALREEVKAHMRLQVAQTALAVEEWRMKHGRWPDSLERLVPELLDAVPQDPFSEGSIRYARTDNGVVVYSVGEDGTDDGGITGEQPVQKAAVQIEDGWDLTFHLLDPELRGAAELSFRDQIMDGYWDLRELEQAGFTTEKLRELGFSDEDLETFGRYP